MWQIFKRRVRRRCFFLTPFLAYFRFQGLEIPVVALFSIFSLLINLRADNYIECSYHLVFLPVYIAHLHVFMCLFLGDFLNGYFDYVGLQPDWKIKSLFGALTKGTPHTFLCSSSLHSSSTSPSLLLRSGTVQSQTF